MSSLRFDEIWRVVKEIECLDRRFVLTELQPDLHTVHVEYFERDVNKGIGAEPELQQSRRWIIGPKDTESAIVDTCFACVMRSYDHVVQEHFHYQGARVFSPHFEVFDRLQLARRYR